MSVDHLIIDYTNWRGERGLRLIQPNGIKFGCNEWHPEPQWLLRARDIDKGGAEREFAFSGIHSMRAANAPETGPERRRRASEESMASLLLSVQDDCIRERRKRKKLKRKLREASRLRDAARAETDELQKIFNMQWDTAKRAIKRWQEAHPGSDLVWPDATDLLVWLMDQHAAMVTPVTITDADLDALARVIDPSCWELTGTDDGFNEEVIRRLVAVQAARAVFGHFGTEKT